MKRILLFSFIIASIVVYGQTQIAERPSKVQIENKTWKTSVHCFTSPDITRYELYEKNDSILWDWGNTISFEDGKFGTSYSAPCGNDCFTHVTGTYEFKGVNRIEVYVGSISRNGFCSLESEKPKKVFGIYRIESTENGFSIIKE